MRLFAVFVAVPLIEIALFIQVGGWLGLWPTLAIVVLTAAIGTALVRRQGLEQIARVRASIDRLSDPTRPLAHGAMILAAGLLLLTPGFFTDAVGFALLVPALREAAIARVGARLKGGFTVGGRPMGETPGAAPEDVLEGDYTVRADTPPRPRDPSTPPSGWTRGDPDDNR